MTTTSLSGQLPDPARSKYDELLLSLLVERFGRTSTSMPRAVTTDAAIVLRNLRRERPGPAYSRTDRKDAQEDVMTHLSTSMTQEQITALPPVIDVTTAAAILGVGRTAAYELIRTKRWPTPVLRLGKLIRIPTKPLLDLVGLGR
jgi:predicted DNA-binding transcriptional regulator AlpA